MLKQINMLIAIACILQACAVKDPSANPDLNIKGSGLVANPVNNISGADKLNKLFTIDFLSYQFASADEVQLFFDKQEINIRSNTVNIYPPVLLDLTNLESKILSLKDGKTNQIKGPGIEIGTLREKGIFYIKVNKLYFKLEKLSNDMLSVLKLSPEKKFYWFNGIINLDELKRLNDIFNNKQLQGISIS